MSSRDHLRPAELERELELVRDEVRSLLARAAEDAADIARLRAELTAARSRIATLEREPEIVQSTAFKTRLVESEAARAVSERAAHKATREAQVFTEQLANARDELRAVREQMAERAEASVLVVNELAALRRETQVVKAQSVTALVTATAQSELRISELTEAGAAVTVRAEQAETRLRETEARVKDAEARVEQATARAATAEARVVYLEKRVADHDILSKQADEEYALARRQIVALESRLEALDASLAAMAPDAAKRAGEALQASLRAAALEELADVTGEIGGDPTERAMRMATALADKQVQEAARRIEEADSRATASETMARAMAKDVAEALHRAAESELQVRNRAGEYDDAQRRAAEAEAEHAKLTGALADAQARAAKWEDALQSAAAEHRKVTTANQAALDSSRRELAAERSTAAALADVKRQLDGELAELRGQLSAAVARAGTADLRASALEAEVAAADHVRSFAAETEREIAELQRQLHDARRALAEIAVERDRLATAEWEVHADREPTNPLGERTVHYMPGLEELVRRTATLEDRVVELERDNAQLRDQLARAKQRRQ